MEDKILERTEKGKLRLNNLELQILLDDLFAICETEDDTEWLSEKLIDYVRTAEDERNEAL